MRTVSIRLNDTDYDMACSENDGGIGGTGLLLLVLENRNR